MRKSYVYMRTVLAIVALAVCPSWAAELVGLWEFEDAALSNATIGADLTFTGSIGATAGVGGTDGAASVDVDNFITAPNPIGANGTNGTNDVPTRSNEYTLLLDFKIPVLATYISLVETTGGDDGDYFYSNSNGLGVRDQGYVGNAPPTSVVADTWHRLMLTVDLAGTTSTYVDGIHIGDHTSTDGVDSRWSLGATFDLFSDNGGGEEALVHVSNIALFDGRLTTNEVTELGVAGDPIGESLDTDMDGMLDIWEMANGLDHTSAIGVNGADGDLDEDGQSNINEMLAGTAANDPLSLFIITEIGEDTGSGVPLTWSSVPGKQYKINISENLGSWAPLMDGGSNVVVDAAAGTNTTHVVPMANDQLGFVKVEVLVD